MKTPSSALAWEIWRRNRWGFALLGLLFAGCMVWSAVVHHFEEESQHTQDFETTSIAQDWRTGGLVWSTALMGFSVLALFAIFAGTEPMEGRGFTGIPSRRFTLPVRTGTVVAWPLLVGSIAVLALVVGWSRLVFPPLLGRGTPMPQFYLALLLLAALSLFQALTWGLPSFPKTRITLLTLLICGLFVLAALPFQEPSPPLGKWEATFVVSWLLGIAGAYLGVSLERRGAWAGLRRRSRLADLIRWLSPGTVGFSSGLSAQIWFEWKRNSRLPFIIWMLLMWLVGGGLWLATRSPAIVVPIVFFFYIFVAIAGLNLARDGTSKKLALSTFTATRPLSTGVLVTAKLIAGLTLWFIAILILGVGVLVWLASAALSGTGSFRPTPHPWEWIVIALCLVLGSLHVFIGIQPLCLSGRIRGIPWSLLPLLLIVGLVLNAWWWFTRHQWPRDLTSSVLWSAVALKLAVAFWAFRRGMTLRLISPAFAGCCLAVWLVVTYLCAAAIFTASTVIFPSTTLPAAEIPASTLLAAGLLAVPLARIALAPLALDLNRHR